VRDSGGKERVGKARVKPDGTPFGRFLIQSSLIKSWTSVVGPSAVVKALVWNWMKIFQRFSHWTQRVTCTHTHTHTCTRVHTNARAHAHTHAHLMLRTLSKHTQYRLYVTSVGQISFYGFCQKCWGTKYIQTTYYFWYRYNVRMKQVSVFNYNIVCEDHPGI